MKKFRNNKFLRAFIRNLRILFTTTFLLGLPVIVAYALSLISVILSIIGVLLLLTLELTYLDYKYL